MALCSVYTWPKDGEDVSHITFLFADDLHDCNGGWPSDAAVIASELQNCIADITKWCGTKIASAEHRKLELL